MIRLPGAQGSRRHSLGGRKVRQASPPRQGTPPRGRQDKVMIGREEVEDCDKGGRGTEDITKRLSKAHGAFFNLEKILVGIQKSNYTI